jgi:integrase
MASIQQRTTADRKTTYRVQVRVRGFPPQTATFTRKTDARRWAEQTEAAMHEGRYFTTNEARRHTLVELIDRYLARLEKTKPHAVPKQRQLLGWWQQRLGPYALAHITPAIIAKERDTLLTENIGTAKHQRFRMPSTANRYLAALSKLFSVAIKEWHLARDNPVRRIEKGEESPGRVRYLSGDERERLLAACCLPHIPASGARVDCPTRDFHRHAAWRDPGAALGGC